MNNYIINTTMEQVVEKALKYAEEKSKEYITSIIAKAYEDGYRDGYKDREEEIPVDLRDNKTEYVDLGLPSGTLWAKDYEQRDGKTIYLPYCEASKLNIPTKEQLNELISRCLWEINDNTGRDYDIVKCAGPNGNVLFFPTKGRILTDEVKDRFEVYIWALDKEDGHKTSLYARRGNQISTVQIFSGNKLPVRLVKSK